MALVECNFFSDVLGVSVTMNVILPQRTLAQIGLRGVDGGDEFPVLYLLHGLSDDHSIWLRRTSIERYAAELGLAVVMPAVNRSFYTDMKHGYRYWTFISEELPRLCRGFFRLSPKREHTFAAGLSMGGYGAFKLALRCPQRFAAAASLSGALDLQPGQRWVDLVHDLRLVFGSPNAFRNSHDDLFHLARVLARRRGPRPRLYACCGTEDFLLADNRRFRDLAGKLKLDLVYEEHPGTHEWGYWDRQIQRVLEWLPLPGRAAPPC